MKKASAGAVAAIALAWYEENIATLEGEDPLKFVGLLPGDSPALLQEAMNILKARQFQGVAAVGVLSEATLHLGAVVHSDHIGTWKAGDIVRESLAIAGGKGGGKPEMARGAAPNADGKVDDVLAKAAEILGVER